MIFKPEIHEYKTLDTIALIEESNSCIFNFILKKVQSHERNHT